MSKYDKKDTQVTKHGHYFDIILCRAVDLLRNTNTTKDPTDSVLQYILVLSVYTIKENWFHLVGYIVEFLNLKKQTVAEEIMWSWE